MKLDIPGFIDLQVNGFKGIDFSDPELTPEDFIRACTGMLDTGTAAFLPTVITSSPGVYARNLPLIADALDLPQFTGRLPGIHIEGPFISPEPGAVGAHNPRWTRPTDTAFFDQMQNWARGKIKLLTIAAELPGADKLARHAAQNGVTVSLGHQLALENDLERLRNAGAKAITHLGNGLPNMLPRLKNTIWAGLAADNLATMLIADGHHLPESVLKVALRAKGVQNTIIVSDAAPLAGMPPGEYKTLGNSVILEESGLLHNPAKGCMVGSSATMLQCMNHLAYLKLLDLPGLLAVGYHNPLRLLNLDAPPPPASGKTLHYDQDTNTFCMK